MTRGPRPRAWRCCRTRWRPSSTAQRTDVTVAASASLLNQVGQCQFRHGRYEQARATLDKALEIAYRIYGEDNRRRRRVFRRRQASPSPALYTPWRVLLPAWPRVYRAPLWRGPARVCCRDRVIEESYASPQ